MILLGIVGSPASGKSTVARYLEAKGARWINADIVAREVLNRADVTQQLADFFGENILDSTSAINRSALADHVFGNTPEHQANLDYLESIIHPPTRQEIVARLTTAARESVQAAILDVPLLFQSQWDKSCDQIWCLDAPDHLRLQWAATRGWDAAELQRREANQLRIEEKRRLSNVILSNDASLSDLRRKLDFHWSKLVILNSTGPSSGSAAPGDLFGDTHCFTDHPR